MQENHHYKVAVVGVVILVGIFLLWGLAGLFSLNEASNVAPGSGAGEEPVAKTTGPDLLITAASKLYTSLILPSDPRLGEGDLVILEFGDFECPYCAQVYPELRKIVNEYPNKITLAWKDFPNPVHLNARTAALSARCAAAQGKFWEYHDYLFANQASLSRETYNKIALELNLDLATFNECVDKQEKISEVGQGLVDGQKLDVDATPYLFIGNKRYDYALTYEELKEVVEEELK